MLLVTCVWFSGGELAQAQTINIGGPLKVRPGQLVRLIAEIEPEESPFWLVLSPSNLDFEQIENGKRLIFAAPLEEQNSIVVMLLAQQVKDGKILTKQLIRRIDYDLDGSPVPPNRPLPNPQPVDQTLRKLEMYRVVGEAWQLMQSTGARGKGAEIAVGFRTTAKRCEAGDYSRPDQIWEDLSVQNNAILGNLSPLWEGVGSAIQHEFKRLQLPEIKSHSMYLHAIALALEDGGSK